MSDAAEDSMTAVTSEGKTLTLKVVGPSQMLDLFEAAGAASGNSGWMNFALIVASVVSIDGVPLPTAFTKKAVKANADKIGHAGIEAAMNKLRGGTKPDDGADEVDAEIEAAKN